MFLVDDVDSELDELRMNELLQILESKVQVFVAATKLGLMSRNSLHLATTFQVESGQVKESAEAW